MALFPLLLWTGWTQSVCQVSSYLLGRPMRLGLLYRVPGPGGAASGSDLTSPAHRTWDATAASQSHGMIPEGYERS